MPVPSSPPPLLQPEYVQVELVQVDQEQIVVFGGFTPMFNPDRAETFPWVSNGQYWPLKWVPVFIWAWPAFFPLNVERLFKFSPPSIYTKTTYDKESVSTPSKKIHKQPWSSISSIHNDMIRFTIDERWCNGLRWMLSFLVTFYYSVCEWASISCICMARFYNRHSKSPHSSSVVPQL